MVRIGLVVGALILGALLLGASHQAMAATPPVVGTPPVVNHPATPTPARDPLLGGDLTSKVPVSTNCRDFGQCAGIAPGTPCDTPIGCVCGWASGQRYMCGKF